MLVGDRKCYCGQIIDKRWYQRHHKGPAHKRRLAERRKLKQQPKEEPKQEPIKEVKISNFQELLT